MQGGIAARSDKSGTPGERSWTNAIFKPGIVKDAIKYTCFGIAADGSVAVRQAGRANTIVMYCL